MEIGKKKIVVVGGGISGLSLLHYLKVKYCDNDQIEIQLLEKNEFLGGTIRSIKQDNCLFEAGPNGFLDSKPRTLRFIKEINAEQNLIRAQEEAKVRYISIDNKLHALPFNPKSFFKFELLSFTDKLRILTEPFIPKGKNPKESVYAFGKRRLGRRFPELFLDAMVKGIYGGNARQINLKLAFPRIYELEQAHGSLFKAMRKVRKEKRAGGQIGAPSGQLTSFEGGMQEIVDVLGNMYRENIRLSCPVDSLSFQDDQYLVCGGNEKICSDEIYLAIPSYHASKLLKNIEPKLTNLLDSIEYAPIAVAGFVFDKTQLQDFPKGFGFLIPSSEKKEVMGVLFDSNIYPGRCAQDQVLLRVMIGGSDYPKILKKGEDELKALALKELENYVKIEGSPRDEFFVSWVRAIPQYTNKYLTIKEEISSLLENRKNLHLNANYLGGISFNDCVENAYLSAQRSKVV